jgi:hypothetical protein
VGKGAGLRSFPFMRTSRPIAKPGEPSAPTEDRLVRPAGPRGRVSGAKGPLVSRCRSARARKEEPGAGWRSGLAFLGRKRRGWDAPQSSSAACHRKWLRAAHRWLVGKKGITFNDRGRGLGLVHQALRYALFRQGMMAMTGAPIRAFVCSREGLEAPDLMLGWIPMLTNPTPRGPRIQRQSGVTLYAHAMRSESKGPGIQWLRAGTDGVRLFVPQFRPSRPYRVGDQQLFNPSLTIRNESQAVRIGRRTTYELDLFNRPVLRIIGVHRRLDTELLNVP